MSQSLARTKAAEKSSSRQKTSRSPRKPAGILKDKLNRDANGVTPDGHQYLWGLGLDEEHISVHGLCSPTMKLAAIKAKGHEAAALEKLGGGDLSVTFMPGMFYEGDRDAANHLYHVRLDETVLGIDLDDRDRSNGLGTQLVDRLNEAADNLRTLAKRINGILVEQACRDATEHAVESGVING